MKKAPLILTLAFLLLLSGILLLYKQFFERSSLSVWDVVPSQTVLVYEAGECEDCIRQISATSFWEVISRSLIRSISNDSISKLFASVIDSKSKGFISLHVTQKDDFDFVFYLSQNKAEGFMTEVRKRIENQAKYSQREFNGVQINELDIGGKVLSWATLDELWVASYTSFLLEDVIRTYKSGKTDAFKNNIDGVLQLPRIRNDAGNIYINLRTINTLLSLFLERKIPLSNFGQAALLDIKQSEKSLTLNGFSLVHKDESGTLLSCFSDQSPVPFGIKRYVSNRSVLVTNYGISNGLEFFNRIDLSSNKRVQDSLQSLAKVDLGVLFSSLGKEMTLCYFESRSADLSRVLLFNTSAPDSWLSFFDQLSKATEREDSLYYEKYSVYEIRQIEIERLPEKLFSPLIKGFDRTYYTHIDGTLLISDRVEELRKVLSDIDQEEVWGKSIIYNQFLESTLLESNISFYINTPRALSAISSKLNFKWSGVYTSSGRNFFNGLGLSAFQFSHLNESFYTNFTWSFTDNKEIEDKRQASLDRISSTIDQTIVSSPFVARNHATKREDFVVLDTLNNIHYFSADGKRQWRKDIGGKIIGDVHQVDFLANNKFQLFFVTPGKLHVIDRLGNYVSPFPLTFDQQNVEFVSVVDYDNSKKYRFLLTDRSGKLWLLDKEGRNLEGWKPRNVEGPLFASPNHHRIRGKDFFLAIRKDGWAYLLNRRGENVKGFPLNLDARPDGTYFLEPGNTLATSYFVVVSKDGVRIKFNVEGKVVGREPLIKTAVDDQFSLIAENNQKAYLIKRQNSRQLSLLDEEGKSILTNDFVGAHAVDVQFYDFGSGRSYIAVSDLDQDLCYVYDIQGSLLTRVPYEATGVSLKFEGDKAFMALVNGGSLTIQPISD